MSKESIDERFDAEKLGCCIEESCDGDGKSTHTEKLKSFIRKELADQKNRAIEIVENQKSALLDDSNFSQDVAHNQTCGAIATALKEEL